MKHKIKSYEEARDDVKRLNCGHEVYDKELSFVKEELKERGVM